jgi:hypothetical protein
LHALASHFGFEFEVMSWLFEVASGKQKFGYI